MRDFPKLDRQAEDRALQTLFFRESEFEGKPCRVSVANYLAFLSLRGSDIKAEVQKLRSALSVPTSQHLERDIAVLLQASNWRFHNIACVAIACCGASDELLSQLWRRVQLGSWTSPQLAATAAFVDPSFASKASSMVEDQSTYYKSIVGLAALLGQSQLPSLSPVAQVNIAEASAIDRDNSGAIAVGWHANLCEAFPRVA
jgi:hypothetical protein